MVLVKRGIHMKKAKKANPVRKMTGRPIIKTKEPTECDVVDTGEDLFLSMNGKKEKFASQLSPFYAVKEFFFKGVFTSGSEIKLLRDNGEEVPVHHSANCGYTLVGKAQRFFQAAKALCANGEASDDQEYVYINEHSTLSYIGPNEEHTLYVRVYDNLTGVKNDRWVVIYID